MIKLVKKEKKSDSKYEFYECEKCHKQVPAWYILSLLTEQLWVACPTHRVHVRPFVSNLNLPFKPSTHYLKNASLEQMEKDATKQFFKDSGLKFLNAMNNRKKQTTIDDAIRETEHPTIKISSYEREYNRKHGIPNPDEEAIGSPQANINHLIKLYEKIDVLNYKSFFTNRTERRSLEQLVEGVGFEKIEKLIEAIPELNQTQYAPSSYRPSQLIMKYQKYVDYYARLEKYKQKK